MSNLLPSIRTIFYIFLFYTVCTFGQNPNNLLKDYLLYAQSPREVAYVHLNKSTYLQGEMMGFTAYVFNKINKKLSKETTNLYCSISDKNGRLIKEKLLKVDKGIASNVFYVDSTLPSGIYTFKAYTNWMRNFDEPNHFQQTIKVIDADIKGNIEPVNPKDFEIDLQILGEGGHILYDVENTVGIIAKNQFGKGIKNAVGSIIDSSNNEIAKFQLNDVGIAKSLFIPKPTESYSITLQTNNGTIKKPITDIDIFGISMQLLPSRENLILNLKTNTQTLQKIKNKDFKVALHNGHDVMLTEITIDEKGESILYYPKEELNSGINIFTIFNADHKPILERLYFNKNFDTNEIEKINAISSNDSLSFKLNFYKKQIDDVNNLSISVLPKATKAYNHNSNILSQIYIQPYIKSAIENASKYFSKDDEMAIYNLDLLMLTQGWSSYDWTKIFNYNDKFIYPFERGVDVVANINKSKNGTYVLYPNRTDNTQIFSVVNKEKEFTIKSIFPNEYEKLRIGFIEKENNGFNSKPTLSLQYFPNSFPNFSNTYEIIEESYTLNESYLDLRNEKKAWDFNKVQALDEVVVKADKRYTRFEKLAQRAINTRYAVIDEYIKKRGMRIDIYLQRLGWATDYDIFSGKLSIVNPRVKWGDPVPLVYLDGALLTTNGLKSDFGILASLSMDFIDYIEYDIYGFGGGIKGNAGFIKIFTGPTHSELNPINNVVSYEAPLKFSKDKKFYTPKYASYESDFFREYGTIDWIPSLNIKNGIAEFKVKDFSSTDVTLFIEGVIGGQFVSQKIEVKR